MIKYIFTSAQVYLAPPLYLFYPAFLHFFLTHAFYSDSPNFCLDNFASGERSLLDTHTHTHTHTHTLLGFANVPTNRPIPAHHQQALPAPLYTARPGHTMLPPLPPTLLHPTRQLNPHLAPPCLSPHPSSTQNCQPAQLKNTECEPSLNSCPHAATRVSVGVLLSSTPSNLHFSQPLLFPPAPPPPSTTPPPFFPF